MSKRTITRRFDNGVVATMSNGIDWEFRDASGRFLGAAYRIDYGFRRGEWTLALHSPRGDGPLGTYSMPETAAEFLRRAASATGWAIVTDYGPDE